MTENDDIPAPPPATCGSEAADALTINEAARKAAEEISRRVAQARARREVADREGEAVDALAFERDVVASIVGHEEIEPDAISESPSLVTQPSIIADAVAMAAAADTSLATVVDQPAAPNSAASATSSDLRPALQVSTSAISGAPNRERHAGYGWGSTQTSAQVKTTATLAERSRATHRHSWPLLAAITLLLLLLVVHVWPFEARRQQLEQGLSVQLQQRVHIEGLRLSLLPQPHWRIRRIDVFEGDARQAELRGLRAYPVLAELFSPQPQLQRLKLAEAHLASHMLNQALFAQSPAATLQTAELTIERLYIDLPGLALPVLAAQAQFVRPGQWQQLTLTNTEFNWHLQFTPQDGHELKLIAQLGRWPEISKQVADTTADAAALAGAQPAATEVAMSGTPRLGALPLNVRQLYLQGQVSSQGMNIQELSALLVADSMQANLRATARLAWQQTWQLSGQAELKGLDAAHLAPAWFASGRVDLASRFEFQAATPAQWFAAPHLQGEFTVHRGSVLGVDLGRVLQGGSAGGQSLFAALQGRFDYVDRVLNLTAVRLESGAINALGQLRVAPDDAVRGSFAVELKSGAHQRQAGLEVTGELGAPRFEMR